METYIAIKKRNAGRAKTALAVTPARAKLTKRRRILTPFDEAVQKALVREGMEKVEPSLMESSLLASSGRRNRSLFSRLDHVEAFIFEASQPKIAKAQEMLQKDYHVVPDIQLSLPQIIGAGTVGKKAVGPSWPDITGIKDAHQSGIKGKEVIMAVLDTGVDADHVQFADTHIDFRYFPPHSPREPRTMRGFDPSGHGTHVCGIIAGKSIGVAPEVDMMVASVIESEQTSTSLRRIVSALDWISEQIAKPEHEEKPVILNLSLGFKPRNVNQGSQKLLINAVRDMMRGLMDTADVLSVVAIGNEGAGNYCFPGAFPEVLGVGVVDANLQPWRLSGGGRVEIPDTASFTKPDVVGYGVDIYSACNRNLRGHSRYVEQTGSSMAAPYVAGVAALVAQRYGLRGEALRRKLEQDILPLEAHAKDRVGTGLVRYQ